MADLMIEFACGNPAVRAEEFQHHLIGRKITTARVHPEAKENEIWLTFLNVQSSMIDRVIREAHPWCLDRGLSLMRSSNEGGTSEATVLLIADLTRVVE